MANLAHQRIAARHAFADAFGTSDAVWAAYAPGRVNLIGDHTDYTGGFVLPMSIDRGTHVLVRARPDNTVRVVADGFGEASWSLGTSSTAHPLWARYVFGTAREVASRAATTAGADLYITGDVPVGAGLSSSASLAVAVALGLAAAWDVALSETEIALLAQRVEHVDADVQCGIMDQVAVRSGRAGHAVLLDCRSLQHEAVPVPTDEVAVVIVDSRVGRSLADSAYNARRAAVEAATATLARLGVTTPDGTPVASLRDVTLDDLNAYAGALGDALPRARHIVTENARVVEAAAALRAGDVDTVGRLMLASHASLRDDYEVSGPELDYLVDAAHACGALGARLTGAGFGGCTVNLVPLGRVEDFATAVPRGYRKKLGLDAEVFAVHENHEASVEEPA